MRARKLRSDRKARSRAADGARWCVNCGRQVFTDEGHYDQRWRRYRCSREPGLCLCGHLELDHHSFAAGPCKVPGCGCGFLRVYEASS